MHINRKLNPLFACSAALLLSAAGVAGAQSQPGMAPQQQQQTPSQQQGQMNPSQGTSTTDPGQAQMQEMGDHDFLRKALDGDNTEVQLGQLAQQKSQSADVKQFGQKMVADHTQLAENIKPLVQQMGVKESKGPSKKDKELMAKLQGLSGDQFDQAYIEAMLKDHKQDLKDFKREADMTQNPNVKMAAQQGATVISEHLQMIQQIAQSHNVPTDGKTKSGA